MYEVFVDSHAYSYKAVNKYNIPYAMLRYQKAISIYRSFLFDSPMSEIVKDRINSMYFEIPDKGIVKKASGFYNIGIYFTKYQRKEHKQYLDFLLDRFLALLGRREFSVAKSSISRTGHA
jgi:hypothetical protein